MPRICAPEIEVAADGGASMRPRRKCLGYGAVERNKNIEFVASMRPRRKCLGYFAQLSHSADRENASMRPRRKCLGYEEQPAHQGPAHTASMRPRRKCLGYVHLITCCLFREYLCVFERGSDVVNETHLMVHGDCFIMVEILAVPIFRQIRAGAGLAASPGRSKVPGGGCTRR